jgi:DNA-binding FadR family transcriptional regulator
MQTTKDNAEFVAADVAFHLAIAQAAGNESLLQIMRSIRSLLEVWIKRVAYASGTRPATWAEHAAVFEAIVGCDPEGARHAMAGHMEGAADRLRHTFSEYEKAGGTLDGQAPSGASGVP